MKGRKQMNKLRKVRILLLTGLLIGLSANVIAKEVEWTGPREIQVHVYDKESGIADGYPKVSYHDGKEEHFIELTYIKDDLYSFYAEQNAVYTVYALDNADREVTKTEVVSNIDVDAPSTPVIDVKGTYGYRSDAFQQGISLHLQSSDTQSGVKSYEVELSGIGKKTCDVIQSDGSCTLEIPEELNQSKITVTAIDTIGNQSEAATTNISAENNPCVITSSYTGETKNTSFSMPIHVDDTGSGIHEITYEIYMENGSVDAGIAYSSETIVNSKDISIQVPEQARSIRIYADDNSGNHSEKEFGITIEIPDPTADLKKDVITLMSSNNSRTISNKDAQGYNLRTSQLEPKLQGDVISKKGIKKLLSMDKVTTAEMIKGLFPAGTTLHIDDITGLYDQSRFYLDDVIKIFDVYLMRNDNKVPAEGEIKVEIDLKELPQYFKNMKIYKVVEDGTIEDMTYTMEEERILTYNTNTLGKIVITGTEKTCELCMTNFQEHPSISTAWTVVTCYWYILLLITIILVLIALSAYKVYLKYKQNK